MKHTHTHDASTMSPSPTTTPKKKKKRERKKGTSCGFNLITNKPNPQHKMYITTEVDNATQIFVCPQQNTADDLIEWTETLIVTLTDTNVPAS